MMRVVDRIFLLGKTGLLASLLMVLSGCVSVYVDNGTKEIDSAQFKKQEKTHPVMVLFEFQTKGVANARATDLLKEKVFDQVKKSTLFSEVSTTPVEGGRVLSITLNNVPTTDDAFSKGFVTGFTFGLVGSEVSDGYVCTARYLGRDGKEPVTKQARHVIHATLGAKAAPSNAVKAASMEEAATVMTHQVVSNVLNDLSYDPNFQ